MIDTTGDGLTDAQQLEGWEIEVVDDSSEAQELMEVAVDPDDPRDASSFFSTRDVSADPLLDDTDGEGLPDAVEFELGTDPEQIDTTSFGDIALTGDGIPDDEALEDPDKDPTIFSTSPPEIYLKDFDSHWTLGKWGDASEMGSNYRTASTTAPVTSSSSKSASRTHTE
ncbi:hypothetical protein CP556_07280 [Natrinema sp. CBA1119]|uniref:hypothetical protein n=1 Tax=Natrinema sp. CBA1119 TaxID=1608465 RepID=UPI000BF3549C|nr:hypothetical protein [Natrinema sp. CBA1119]PGF15938.1 hypothetical protein CP556_07280 [Natrinema sp. CBA1119]